jgi:hypothetical protein
MDSLNLPLDVRGWRLVYARRTSDGRLDLQYEADLSGDASVFIKADLTREALENFITLLEGSR